MTKAYFLDLAGFNIWANEITLGWLEQISDDQWKQEIVSSFSSIGETVLHLASAEKTWVDRLHQVASPVWLASVFKGSRRELVTTWREASANLEKYLENFDEIKMNENLAFKRLNGESYAMPYYQVFAHVINHSTYHRGQLVTMLRQAGFAGVGSTDLLAYYRKKN